MVKNYILEVSYLIDGEITTIPTKVVRESLDDDEVQKIHYEVVLRGNKIISKSGNSTESAIIKLQEVLPEGVNVACCQSCRLGNFCPFGDFDNEIFCFKGVNINNKNDVCQFFLKNRNSVHLISRKLLDVCNGYEPISGDDYYTYNDWNNKKTC